MRRFFGILLGSIALSMLCSCKNAGLSSTYAPSAAKDSSSSDISDPSAASADVSPLPSAAENKPREAIFRAFLAENYQKLSDACFGGISGVGFLDLDLDGGIEMLIFDAGASAAMGLQFFDIVGDRVECVSANMQTVGALFGGEHLSELVVNANHFEDFRLVEDSATGEKFFIVESGNGAVDFLYTELIRFGSDNGTLTLRSLMFKHEDFNADSGALTGESFKLAGDTVSRAEYEAAYSGFFGGIRDTGYKARGVFLWEDSGYETSYDGLMSMADKALALYGEN